MLIIVHAGCFGQKKIEQKVERGYGLHGLNNLQHQGMHMYCTGDLYDAIIV